MVDGMTRWARSVLLLAIFLMAITGVPAFDAASGAVGSASAAARSTAVDDAVPDAVLAPRAHARFFAAAMRLVPMAAFGLCAGPAVHCVRRLGIRGAVSPRLDDVGDGWRALLVGAPPSFL